jgi:gluconate 2-dehydrogenase alpha chain
MTSSEADVVIVGMGWAGSILAAELSKAGLHVIGLERGTTRDPDDELYRNAHDELRFAVRGELVQDTARETWTLRHDLAETALPIRYAGSFRPGEGVGGSGIAWGGAVWRFQPADFTFRSSTLERGGTLPDDSCAADWPVSYAELEPYYDRFERTLGVTGIAGNVRGKRQARGNPFEGERSNEYPLPPLKPSDTTAKFHEAALLLGWHPFPQPVANSSLPYTNPDGVSRGACTYCGTCAFHPCRVGAKADPLVTLLPVARRHANFELRSDARVFRVVHDGKRARGVLYHDSRGRIIEQRAALVILAAYTLGNVRLLLLSGIGRPYDPTTGRGIVGRNYSYQVMLSGSAFFEDQQFRRYMGATGVAAYIDDFMPANLNYPDLDFVGGGMIGCGARGGAPISGLVLPPGTPAWGREWKSALQFWYDRVVTVIASGQVLPYRTSFLDLDPNYKDAWGNPLLRITFDWRINERRLASYLGNRVNQALKAMQPTYIAEPRSLPAHYDVVPYQSTHNSGGAVMGGDPATSMVNRYLQAWDVPNVFVVGASAFPQSSGHGPTGTVGALAYWAADAILDRYLRTDSLLA